MCEYCNRETKTYENKKLVKRKLINKNSVFVRIGNGNELKLFFDDKENGLDLLKQTIINYCPLCGQKLQRKEW